APPDEQRRVHPRRLRSVRVRSDPRVPAFRASPVPEVEASHRTASRFKAVRSGRLPGDMAPLASRAAAPSIDGAHLGTGPAALFFYKVTCPVCRMAAPKAMALERAYPGAMLGIGQDPEPALGAFADEYGLGITSVSDRPPFPASDAYGIAV